MSDLSPASTALEEIKSRIGKIQEKPLDGHSGEYASLYQELNRILNEIDGI
jgi:hypothetical protein